METLSYNTYSAWGLFYGTFNTLNLKGWATRLAKSYVLKDALDRMCMQAIVH